MRAVVLLLLLFHTALVPPASADTILSPSEFEAMVAGRTLSYARRGHPHYGAEQYFPDRRVTWSFADGYCQEGRWYPKDELICFEYHDVDGEICWEFFLRSGRLTARVAGDPPDETVYVVDETTKGIDCKLPGVGA